MYYITPPMFMLDILSFDNANSSASNVNAATETIVMIDTPFLLGLVLIDSLFNQKKKTIIE